MSSIGQVPTLQDRQHRQFLSRLKESVESLSARVSATNTDAEIAALRKQLAAMAQAADGTTSTPSAPVTPAGRGMVLLAADVDIWRVLAETPDGAVVASTTTAEHANMVIGISLAAGVTGDAVPLAITGDTVADEDWAWTPGAVLWLGADGALFDPAAEGYVPPEVAPLFAQPIGIALDATTIFVALGLPVLAGDGGPFLALNDSGFVERASVRANILLAEDVPAFSVVAQAAAGAVAADNTVADHAGLVLGITAKDGLSGEYASTAASGNLLMNEDWTWTPGAILWLGVAGGMIETPTATETDPQIFQQPVAIALTATIIYVSIGVPVLLGDGGSSLSVNDDGLLTRQSPRVDEVSSLPAAGDFGRVSAYDKSLWVDNGQIWVRAGPKVGTVAMLAHTSADAGWYLCNGAAKSRTGFPELFAAIGTTYGAGDGSTTFNLPNLTDRFAMGNTPGASGGANTDDLTHTHDTSSLTISSAGSHSHSESSAGSHSHSAGYNGGHNHGGGTEYESNGSATVAAGSDYNASGSPHYHVINSVSDHTHTIGSAGSHTHTIDADGTHTHTISGALDDSLTDPHDNRPAYTGFAFYIFAGR